MENDDSLNDIDERIANAFKDINKMREDKEMERHQQVEINKLIKGNEKRI